MMKKCVIILLLSITSIQAKSQAVSMMRDPYVNRQLENMVFMRWGGFKPKWYYFLFHNKYRKGPDRRTMLQLLPTDAVIRVNEEKSEDEADDVQEMYAMQYWDAANRSLELHYHFHFKPIFDQLNEDIEKLKNQVKVLEAAPQAIRRFVDEQDRLNGEIEIIREGWLEKGDSAEAMKQIEKDLRELKGNLMKFLTLQAINQKYLNIQP